MKRLFLMMLSVVLMVSFFTGCTDEGEIAESSKKDVSPEDEVRTTVDGFFTCYNDGDYEGMQEYLSESQRKMMEQYMGFMDKMVEFDMSSLMPMLFGMSSEVLGGEMLAFEIDTIEIDEDEAQVYGNMNVNMAEVSQESYAMIKLEKEDDDWKISYINPQAKKKTSNKKVS